MIHWIRACIIAAGSCWAWFSGAQCLCDALPASGSDVASVTNVSELQSALQQASQQNGHMTIELQPGTYQLNSNLLFIGAHMEALTIRGATGDYHDVVVKGLGWNDSRVTHIFNVAADSFTLADMTIGEVYYHPVQIHSNPNDADDCLIQNVQFVDAKEQLLKVSAGGPLFADRGTVRCCVFEFTAGVAFQYYTGGIDAHRAVDWKVQYNTFRHIRSPDQGLAEHAIHFWRESSGTLVEGNTIIDCDRGIGFGLGPETTSGHVGGIIRSNMVHTSRDVGIGLETAPGAEVFHNTVMTDHYFNSIEYRFAGTSGVVIANNLVSGAISDRSSGSSASLLTNATFTSDDIFVDASQHNYHLSDCVAGVCDAGTLLQEDHLDYDCETSNADPDIGADEWVQTTTSDLVLSDDAIAMYPNPVTDVFTITGLIGSYQIEVIDQVGAVHQSYDQMSDTISIDISALPDGVYFVRVVHAQHGALWIELLLKM